MTNTIQQPDTKTRQVRELSKPPLIAWPTLIIFLTCLAILAIVDYYAVVGQLSLWLGMIINGITIYFLFSAVHDASHGAFSRIKWLNEIPGHIGMLFFGPVAPFNVARYIHMQHHRCTNETENDPDLWAHKIDVFFPIRWTNFDYFYSKYFFMRATPAMRKRLLPHLLIHFSAIIGVLVALVYFGYGMEALMLWILPTRISSFLFVLAFSYLPHEGTDKTAREDEYRATNIRQGYEWLLTPLLAYHNYHLMHHLYPTAPFYRFLKLWKIKNNEHIAKNALAVKTFGITPVKAIPAKNNQIQGEISS